MSDRRLDRPRASTRAGAHPAPAPPPHPLASRVVGRGPAARRRRPARQRRAGRRARAGRAGGRRGGVLPRARGGGRDRRAAGGARGELLELAAATHSPSISLTARLGLDELERALLVLAAAPELDDGIGAPVRLCAGRRDAAVRDSGARRRPARRARARARTPDGEPAAAAPAPARSRRRRRRRLERSPSAGRRARPAPPRDRRACPRAARGRPARAGRRAAAAGRRGRACGAARGSCSPSAAGRPCTCAARRTRAREAVAADAAARLGLRLVAVAPGSADELLRDGGLARAARARGGAAGTRACSSPHRGGTVAGRARGAARSADLRRRAGPPRAAGCRVGAPARSARTPTRSVRCGLRRSAATIRS